MYVGPALWPAAEAAGCSMDGAAAVAVVDGRECVSNPGEGLEKALKAAAARNGTGAVVHDLDHEYEGTSAPSPLSIVVHLYATLGSESFQAFHKVLAKKAASNKIRYIVRHAWPAMMPLNSQNCVQIRQGLGNTNSDTSSALHSTCHRAMKNTSNTQGAHASTRLFVIGRLIG